MRYFILLLIVTIGAFWLGSYAFEHSVDVSVKWGDWGNITLTSTTVLIGAVLGFLALYTVIALLRTIFGLRKRIQNYKQAKLSNKASEELTQGLIHFTEGHWEQSEKTLMNTVKHSEAPLLNYLAAARSAHIQGYTERRDAYLKTATDLGEDAQTAVSVSQAEMQFSCGQIEQARATLINQLEATPKHPYANKLLAKVYYKQEDWNNLFALLPDLNKEDLQRNNLFEKYEESALSGVFHTLAHKKDLSQLQALWKKLPTEIKNKPQSLLLYCEALANAGDDSGSNKLLIVSLNKNWDESLAERYGLIEHPALGSAIKQGEKWLADHPRSPMLLLALARINRQYQLWGKSKSYYNTSLNFSPSVSVYLELAELLDELNEDENAQTCYKLGLNYSIHKKGEMFNLKSSSKGVDPTLAVVPDIDEAIANTST
ncbi:MAG TPA: heme biosynthesis protein HemY [Leucothrix sp.]|nr:heme biosynthesis protein HemY [Leucothrix sp.]